MHIQTDAFVCVCVQLQDRHCGTESTPAFDELRNTLRAVSESSPDIIESLVVDVIRALTGRVLTDVDVDSAISTALRYTPRHVFCLWNYHDFIIEAIT